MGAGHILRDISIHAPQWGATICAVSCGLRTEISIHAPQWGATFCMTWIADTTFAFQSTHPSGVRRSLCHPVLPLLGISIHAPQWGATVDIEGGRNRQPISIHAPQWGATRFPPCPTRNPEYFNPRTPVGCDCCLHGRCRCQWISIHAPQWGATVVSTVGAGANGFQSTHPSGVRQSRQPHTYCRRSISIHAPQWGATTTRALGGGVN